MRGISWLAEKLLASQEGLCSMVLVKESDSRQKHCIIRHRAECRGQTAIHSQSAKHDSITLGELGRDNIVMRKRTSMGTMRHFFWRPLLYYFRKASSHMLHSYTEDRDLNSKPSQHNHIPFIIQNYMFRPISGHPQVHNLCLKHTEEGICLLSSICFKHKLWTWGWPEIGRNM
jgi:hypothetical protein